MKVKSQAEKIEIANVVTHGVGVVYGVVTLPMLWSEASSLEAWGYFAVIVYTICFLLLFSSSTMYHAVSSYPLKWTMKKVDHISIYLMIAGTYLPFILLYNRQRSGFILLGVIWLLAIIGLVFKLYKTGKFRYLSTAVYVGMGISILTISDSFFPILPSSVLLLLIWGGAFYLIGVIFYLNRRLTYHHAIWHLFVLAGAICHWQGVYQAILLSK